MLPEDVLRGELFRCHFSFDGGTYRQTAGIARGTPCAPPLAQLFVAVLEEELRASLDTRWPTLYKRYINERMHSTIAVAWICADHERVRSRQTIHP